MGYRTLEDLKERGRGTGGRENHPSHLRLGHSTGHGSRLKKLNKSIRETARVSGDLRREGAVEDEDAPLPSKELKRSGALFFSKDKLRFSADEDAG